MGELALTSSPDGALQGILLRWLDRASNPRARSHTPNTYGSRLALNSIYAGEIWQVVSSEEGVRRLRP